MSNKKRKKTTFVDRLTGRRGGRERGCYPEGGLPGPGSYPAGGVPGHGCYPADRGPERRSAPRRSGGQR
jgi:hypothetical protein